MESLPAAFEFVGDKPHFEALGRPNGITKWDEAAVMQALGYQTKQSFRETVMRAMQACLTLNIDPGDDFTLTEGSYRLSRFACYLIAMNGDPKKPQIAAAQAYFAALAETFRTQPEHTDKIDRLLIREETKKGIKSLTSTAKSRGVFRFDIFQDKGYRGMYNMPLADLLRVKGLPERANLFDNIGNRELAANLFRITETEARIKSASLRGQEPLENAAFAVGRQVRESMIANDGMAPEHLPAAEPISEVKKTLKATNKKFKKLDSKKPAAKRLKKNGDA